MNTSCLWLTEACNTLRSVYREGASGECTQVDRRLKDPKFAADEAHEATALCVLIPSVERAT